MDTVARCQSCGMPLGEGFFGLTEDGLDSREYCKFCYHNGVFVEPEMSLEEMLQRSIDQMIFEFHFPEEKARAMATTVIPTLKRWAL